MRHRSIAYVSSVIILFSAMARTSRSGPPADSLGAWWKDSEIVRELVLSQSQIKQIEQAFRDHSLGLNNLLADLNRQESILQSLVQSDNPELKSVAAQIDQVVAARGKLEKENTMLVFDIRRAVSIEQWNRLQELERQSANAPAPPPATVNSVPQKAQSKSKSLEEPIYAIGGAVLAPEPVRTPAPPPGLRPMKDDSVVLQAVVGKDGIAKNVRILRSIDSKLSQWLVESIPKQWVFKPGLLNSKQVSVLTTIGLNFHAGKVDIWWDK